MALVQETAASTNCRRSPGEGSRRARQSEPLTLSHVDAPLAPLVVAALAPHAERRRSMAGHLPRYCAQVDRCVAGSRLAGQVDGEAVEAVLARSRTPLLSCTELGRTPAAAAPV